MIVAVLATGPSMSQDVANRVRGLRTVAVSDAWRLAPWAEAICSTDAAWWQANPEALECRAEKYCVAQDFNKPVGVTRLPMSSGSNSGLLGLHVALRMKPELIVLLGFDMRGSHFFGKHKPPLKNTDENRFGVFRRQFAQVHLGGVKVFNCTPNSALDCFPKDTLENVLVKNTIGA